MIVDILKAERAYIDRFCPECKEILRGAYMSPVIFCCLECNIVWELHWRKSKVTIEQVKKDGWLRRDIKQ